MATGPQLAAALPTASQVEASRLTEAQLTPIVVEALARWASLTDMPALSLKDVHIAVADLPDGGDGQLPVLGYTTDKVLIDVNAGGFGWFIDPTPGDDTEFAGKGDAGSLTAPATSPAFGQMDLLTVVMHELGHVYGLEDLDSAANTHDLMATTLVPGGRRLPGQAPRPLPPNASENVGTMIPTPGDQPQRLMVMELVSAFSTHRPGTMAPSSPGVVSRAGREGGLMETRRLPGLSLLDLALATLVPDRRPDGPSLGKREERPSRGGTVETADGKILDAVFTALLPKKPLFDHDLITRNASLPGLDLLLPELDQEMAATLGRAALESRTSRQSWLPGQ